MSNVCSCSQYVSASNAEISSAAPAPDMLPLCVVCGRTVVELVRGVGCGRGAPCLYRPAFPARGGLGGFGAVVDGAVVWGLAEEPVRSPAGNKQKLFQSTIERKTVKNKGT